MMYFERTKDGHHKFTFYESEACLAVRQHGQVSHTTVEMLVNATGIIYPPSCRLAVVDYCQLGGGKTVMAR